MNAAAINQEEAEFIVAYVKQVNEIYGTEFAQAGERFRNSSRLLSRFTRSADEVLSKKVRTRIKEMDEAHNELCVAQQLLSSSEPRFTFVEYEPVHPGCSKTIDFRAITNQQQIIFVDVKTIHPNPVDRWDQYQAYLEGDRFPKNAHIELSKEWLGGELWHNIVTARARMLEHAIGLEAKIRDCNLAGENTFFCLTLCGEGYHWTEDALEDLVSFYHTGRHRPDDPFSKSEKHYLSKNAIVLDRTISRFACMRRPLFELQSRYLNWSVQPPRSLMP